MSVLNEFIKKTNLLLNVLGRLEEKDFSIDGEEAAFLRILLEDLDELMEETAVTPSPSRRRSCGGENHGKGKGGVVGRLETNYPAGTVMMWKNYLGDPFYGTVNHFITDPWEKEFWVISNEYPETLIPLSKVTFISKGKENSYERKPKTN